MVRIVRGLIVCFTRIIVSMSRVSTKDIQANFGQAVRRLRSRRKISQEQLAHDSGLDRSYIGGVERAVRNPSLVAIEKIARGLDVSLAELFAECASNGRKGRSPRSL